VDGDRGLIGVGAATATYRYLNREGRWLDFTRVGLELRPDGALALASLPAPTGSPPPELATLPEPSGPSGIAVLPGGEVFFTDPAGHALLRVDACDGTQRPAGCVAGPGAGPGEVRTPRGLALHRRRGALVLADSGNDRLQVLALPDLQVAEIWGGRDGPCSVACDREGNAYVVDGGTGRVVKLDLLGREVTAFWHAVHAEEAIEAAEVAVGETGGEPLVVVLDRARRVHVLDSTGRRLQRWDSGLARPMGLATDGAAVYLGDNAQRRLLVFALDGTPHGTAHGYDCPVAAVALDGHGGLLVHAGTALAPVRLTVAGAYGSRGLAWGGPFANPTDTSLPRHLLRLSVVHAGDSHLVLHVCEQAAGGAPPPVAPDADDPFADPRWQQLPVAPDAAQTLFPGAPLDEVWVGMAFTSEGATSPVVTQGRIDFAHETLLQYLPAVYQRDDASADVLARWLTLFESEFDHVQAAIDGLPALFDPAAAPTPWLAWLAGWLAVDVPDDWGEAKRRQAIAGAFARDARRGTVAGLREALRFDLGVEAAVEEPILQTGWWALADDAAADAQAALSVLGASTVLAAGDPQGAVVGTSAVLDGSFLSPQDRYATALFADVAHQFIVRLYRGRTYSDELLAAARALLDEARPAHTSCHLCVVEPRMRVGVQARLGVDAIVAGPPEPTLFDDAGAGGLVLGGPPADRLGQTTRLGRTYLTDG
jgi:phage tail-like protein